jgi:integrase
MYSSQLLEIKKFRPAKLCTGKEWFIEYYIYHPVLQKMVRKKIMINGISDKASVKKEYAAGIIIRLNAELGRGWNPYLEEQNSKCYCLLSSTIDEFIRLNNKKYAQGDIRQQTIQTYVSKMKILKLYLEEKKLTQTLVFNFKKDFILKFLDYVYVYRENGSRTRDNYLKLLRLFGSYLVEREYIKVNIANDIAVLGKSKRGKKNRSIISVETIKKISDYLSGHNKNFLLACEILYFCMVRPKEMTYIKIKHIDLIKGTLFIPGETAKNYKDAVVTMPKSLISLIGELKIMASPGDHYLFSDDFRPGKLYRRSKQFNDYWSRVLRPALNLPLNIKMYSLKDTGITDMIRKYNDPIIARDQARHHDLSITNIYTPQDMMAANDRIKNDEGKF